MTNERAEYIRTKVRAALDAMVQEALYWEEIPSPPGLFEPLWTELRDAVVSALFDMDREQADHERDGEYVRRNCL